MKLGILVKPLMLLAVMGLFACQTTSELGGESVEINEDESDLVFYGPGLDGGFRRLIAGRIGNSYQIYGIYGPKTGEYPNAEIVYQRIVRHNYFFENIDIEEEVASWNSKGSTPKIIATGRTKNSVGSIEYATYVKGNESCVQLLQVYGGVAESTRLKGNRLIMGYYCDQGSEPFSVEDAENIARRVSDRSFVKQNASIVSKEIHLSFDMDWGGAASIAGIAVKMTKSTSDDFLGHINFTSPSLGKCYGNMKIAIDELASLDDQKNGDWKLWCGDVTASGDFIIQSKKNGPPKVKTYKPNTLARRSDTRGGAVQVVEQSSSIGVSGFGQDSKNNTISIRTKGVKSGPKNMVSFDLDWGGVGEIENIMTTLLQSKEGAYVGAIDFSDDTIGSCTGDILISGAEYGKTDGTANGTWKIQCDQKSAMGDFTILSDQNRVTGATRSGSIQAELRINRGHESKYSVDSLTDALSGNGFDEVDNPVILFGVIQ